jgi:imidazolonepropionase-like amidohydrolase/Tol biopolymer transport system component
MLLALFPPSFAADAPAWEVDAAHGAVHAVHVDTNEITWANVTVHGNTVVFDALGDLWSVPLSGGDARRLTEGAAWDGQPAFSPDGSLLAYASDRGGNEQIWVMKPDGSERRQVSDEDTARLTDPVWGETNDWLVVRRRTVDTRSIGVTELWQIHVQGGKGHALTSKDEDPHAGEPWWDGRNVWFSTRHGRFEYNQNPVAGLWHVSRLDGITGDIRAVAHGPGSATRPVLSPDRSHLYVVTRDRTATLLEELDLATGRRRVVADWLSPDEMEGFSLHGTYPAMDWTSDGRLVLWAEGQLYKLDVRSGSREPIPVRLAGDFALHNVPRTPWAPADTFQPRVLRWATRSARGAVAFSALGALWVRLESGRVVRMSEGSGFAPAWSANGEDLAWTSWSDVDGGRLHVTPGRGRAETLPISGQLINPTWSDDGRSIAVFRGVGGSAEVSLNDEPYLEVVVLERGVRGWTARVVSRAPFRGSNARTPRLHLHDGRLWWFEDEAGEPHTPTHSVLVSVDLHGGDRRKHLELGGAEEIVLSRDFRWVAWRDAFQVHVAPMPPLTAGKVVKADALPSAQLTHVVGDWLDFSGGDVTWMQGNVFHSVPLARIHEDVAESEGAEALADDPRSTSLPISWTVPRSRPKGAVAIVGARIVSMKGDEVIEKGTVVVRGDRIEAVGADVAVPPDATVVSGEGRTLIPGLVDVHAHLHYSAGDVLPEQDWRYLTALDFGVTTVQDPSASTDLVFTQAERVEAGLMRGPRVFSTGFVLYGALDNLGADTPTQEAAVGHLRRLATVGARSVKVYQQSQRERRQWYAVACRDEGMLCVPEGGGDLWQNLGMIADGYHAIEHALSTAPLYDDVRQYWAGSPSGGGFGTAYTPTLQVAYGGVGGEAWYLQHADPFDQERLLRHTPRRWLDAKLWRGDGAVRGGDWRHEEVARSAAALSRQGVLVSLGAHGELQGLGVHFELWALGGPGAMTPHEALRSATLNGARYLGMDGVLGSIEVGKLADLVLIEGNPLEDLRKTTAIAAVWKNGEQVVDH